MAQEEFKSWSSPSLKNFIQKWENTNELYSDYREKFGEEPVDCGPRCMHALGIISDKEFLEYQVLTYIDSGLFIDKLNKHLKYRKFKNFKWIEFTINEFKRLQKKLLSNNILRDNKIYIIHLFNNSDDSIPNHLTLMYIFNNKINIYDPQILKFYKTQSDIFEYLSNYDRILILKGKNQKEMYELKLKEKQEQEHKEEKNEYEIPSLESLFERLNKLKNIQDAAGIKVKKRKSRKLKKSKSRKLKKSKSRKLKKRKSK